MFANSDEPIRLEDEQKAGGAKSQEPRSGGGKRRLAGKGLARCLLAAEKKSSTVGKRQEAVNGRLVHF